MATRFIQTQAFYLAGAGVSSTDTTIKLQSFQFPDGSNITSSDIGDEMYATLEPGTDQEEVIKFTGVTQNGDGTADLTGVTRGLKFKSPYDQDTSLRNGHAGNTPLVVTNNPQLYDQLSLKDTDESITGTWTFDDANLPRTDSSTALASSDREFITKYHFDTNGGNTSNFNRIVEEGTAGETVAAGDLIYLDESDGEWKKTDGTTASTVEGVRLGIAQGSGTDGNAISNGVLTYGLDESNFTGLTDNSLYYASDTNGNIASSAGTTEKIIGYAHETNKLYFDPNFEYILTADQQDALAGTSGTPSSSNKFVTNDDTATTSTADKIVRADGGGKIDKTFTSRSNSFGGDGSDGAKMVSSNESIDASGNNVVVKNYTSLDLQSGNTLSLTNKATNGTVLWIRVLGDCTIDGTIDLSGQGADGGDSITSTGGSNFADGQDGTDGFMADIITPSTNHFGEGGDTSEGQGGQDVSGGGGGAGKDAGSSSNSTGNAASASGGAKVDIIDQSENTINLLRETKIFTGSGGGSGGLFDEGTDDTTTGSGGNGGGALILEVGGSLNFTSNGSINASGEDGGNGSVGGTQDEAAGGGGGGGGGTVVVLYNSLTANSGSIDVTAGTGGTSATNTDNGSPAATDGANGGAGYSVVAKNRVFAS